MERDLRAVAAWGAAGLVSLIEQAEFEVLNITALPQTVRGLDLWWRHLPIEDMCAPGDDFERRWREDGAFLRSALQSGESFALHCWAGLGRTGTIAARLLVELGSTPSEAMRTVRAARPGAIQSRPQETHVEACRTL